MKAVRAVVLMLSALPAWAEAPVDTVRPLSRPVVTQAAEPFLPIAPSAPALRPRTRPAAVATPAVTAQPDASIRRLAVIRPMPRPAPPSGTPAAPPSAGLAQASPPPSAGLAQAAPPPAEPSPEPPPKAQRRGLFKLALSAPAPRQPEPRPKREKPGKNTSRKGSVCGDPAIKGEAMSRITGKVKGCGVAEPVRVTSVSGVALSQAATIDCPTAKALKKWIDTGLQPAFGRAKVVELRVAAHYICRSRNNLKGARISEHGRGKAIDISGVVLSTGKTVSVAGGYGKELRRAHKAACGIFGTTLGPGSDGFHEDHLHFDTASHRNGPYCR